MFLQLSPTTVEKHISHIKTKLKCYNKPQFIEKAIMEEYLNIIPIRLFDINYIAKQL